MRYEEHCARREHAIAADEGMMAVLKSNGKYVAEYDPDSPHFVHYGEDIARQQALNLQVPDLVPKPTPKQQAAIDALLAVWRAKELAR